MKQIRQMRYLPILVLLFALTDCRNGKSTISSTPQNDTITPVRNANIDPSTLILTVDENADIEAVKKAITDYGAKIIYHYRVINGFAIQLPDSCTLQEAMKHFKAVDGITGVSENRIYKIQ